MKLTKTFQDTEPADCPDCGKEKNKCVCKGKSIQKALSKMKK